jgi:hypothetical protein
VGQIQNLKYHKKFQISFLQCTVWYVCVFHNEEKVNSWKCRNPISNATKSLNLCKDVTSATLCSEFCWILTLQCNKWTAVKTTMISHITVMTWGTLLTEHPSYVTNKEFRKRQLPFPRHSPERRQLSRLCWTRQTINAAPDTLTLGCSGGAVSWQRPRASLFRQHPARFEVFRAAD